MHPIFKALTTLLIIALIADAAFIGYLQFTGRGFGSAPQAVTEETVEASEAAEETPAPADETPPEEEAAIAVPEGIPAEEETAVASPDEASAEEESDAPKMYEGALAGHSPDEIEAMALAEEESAERLTEDKAEASTD